MAGGDAVLEAIGFVGVSLRVSLVARDTNWIWKLAPGVRANVSTERDDGYDAHVGRSDVDIGSLTEAATVETGSDCWLFIGASDPRGGNTAFPVSMPRRTRGGSRRVRHVYSFASPRVARGVRRTEAPSARSAGPPIAARVAPPANPLPGALPHDVTPRPGP